MSRRPALTTVLPDTLLWVALAAPGFAATGLGLNAPRPWWQSVCAVVFLAVAVVASRTRPVLGLLLVAGLSLAASPSLFTLSYGPALAVLAYLLGRRSAGARPALYAFAAIAAAGTLLVVGRGFDPVVEWLVLIGTLLFGAVFPWLVGRYRRQDRELVAAGWSRAAQLEREQVIVADRARLRERARIAQDMHDSLGHELSLIALRAGALQVAPGLDAEQRAAAADLRGAAADATDRLRDIIGILRDPTTTQTAPAPPLTPADETIPALVQRAAASGMTVSLRCDGPAAGVPPMVERAAHRVVQEALTNAAKHAPGAEVTVTVEHTADTTDVTVTNGPAPATHTPPLTTPGGGTGLLGLRERAALAGGTLSAGPYDGGFRVRARLPHTPPAPAGEPEPPHTGEAEALTVASAAGDLDAFARARRVSRRRVVVPFAVVGGCAAVFVAAAFGWYAYIKAHSVLRPADYAQLRVGAPYAAVEPLLPDRRVAEPPVRRTVAAPPAGAQCRYYRASGELFVSVDHFRLCFRDGLLVAKSRIPRVGTAEVVEQEEKEWVR
ncbi:sensor histidine kinase [Streptomyces sp. NPDC001407]|uniref:sensor histidine kinase n=1 Tax=unclassified Streptomyces TaxID=2593676 RepID=UPI0033ECF572